MNQRIFLAIDLHEEQKEKVREVQNQLASSIPSIIRWTKHSQLHITMKFIAEFAPHNLSDINQQMAESLSNVEPFDLRFKDLGVFPNYRNPRILWIGTEEEPAVITVFQRIESIFSFVGYPRDKRPFHPHLTIGRFKRGFSSQDLKTFQSVFNAQKIEVAFTQEVNHLTLYKSELTPQGPIYTVLASHPFKNSST